MLFCLSVHAEEERAILDDESHGEVLDVIEAKSWVEARDMAESRPALDAFTYKAGYGWEARARTR